MQIIIVPVSWADDEQQVPNKFEMLKHYIFADRVAVSTVRSMIQGNPACIEYGTRAIPHPQKAYKGGEDSSFAYAIQDGTDSNILVTLGT